MIWKRVKRLLLSHPWIFARSMPDNPHWYTLRRHRERNHPRDEGTVTHLLAIHGMDVGQGVWDERPP